MSALFAAAGSGDMENVKRLVAEGADVKQRLFLGYTPFLWAASGGHIPIMHWLLTEGGASLDEQTLHGARALSLAARNDRWLTVQWLLEEHGPSMTESDETGTTAWSFLPRSGGRMNVADLSSLLKVTVMLEDVPPFVIAKLSPQHADICTRGRQLRAQLPSYLEQQRAAVVTHCPLPGVLRRSLRLRQKHV
jgi:hypothetical protein